DPLHRNVIFAGGIGGVFRSTDSGRTWSLVNSKAKDAIVVTSSTGVVYAGSTTTGVTKSFDDGITWTRVNEGLPKPDLANGFPRFVLSLAVDPMHPNTLYV